MMTIREEITRLRGIKERILLKKNDSMSDIHLISVEEGIALWKNKNNKTFFYTDKTGNLLFEGQDFKYATPFSNALACIALDKKWYIIDNQQLELVSFPRQLGWKNINGIKQGNIALLGRENQHWGSFFHDREEKTFSKDIPFIWDALDFSREKDNVYIGRCTIEFQTSKDEMDVTPEGIIKIPVLKLPKEYAKDFEWYEKYSNVYQKIKNQNIIRNIQEKLYGITSEEGYREKIKEMIMQSNNISDLYFEERNRLQEKNFDHIKIESINVKEYKPIKGRII